MKQQRNKVAWLGGGIALWLFWAVQVAAQEVAPEGYAARTLSFPGIGLTGPVAYSSPKGLFVAAGAPGSVRAGEVWRSLNGRAELFATGFHDLQDLAMAPPLLPLGAADLNGTRGELWILDDTNGDGAAERRLFGVFDGPLTRLAAGHEGAFFALTPGEPSGSRILRFEDLTGDGAALDPGERTVFFSDANLVLQSIAASPPRPFRLYALDGLGNIWRLEDKDVSGDANGPGERTWFARIIWQLGSIAVDLRENVWVSAATWGSGRPLIVKCQADGDDPDAESDDVREWASWPMFAAPGNIALSGIDPSFLPFTRGGPSLAFVPLRYPPEQNQSVEVIDSDVNADPFADRVAEVTYGTDAGFGQGGLPAIIQGRPQGNGEGLGSTDVLSLGEGGSITIELADNDIVDGAGPDFTVFENTFRAANEVFWFIETAVVSVSEDGVDFREFPFDFNANATNFGDPVNYHGLAGIRPVYANSRNEIDPLDPAASGGDSFDLTDVGLSRARFVRLRDTGDNTYDQDGDLVRDAGEFLPCVTNCGFDLDAIAAIHYTLSPATPTPTPTPQPTETPQGTATPTPEPSFTHTPSPTMEPTQAPVMLALGGYWNTRLTEGGGGNLQVLLIAPGAGSVELGVGGTSAGVPLSDDGTQGDGGFGDGVYGHRVDFPAGSLHEVAGAWLFKAYATGLQPEALWPYLVVR